MRGSQQSLITWSTPNHEPPSKTYLDASIYEEFARWIVDKSATHAEIAANIQDRKWRIIVFRDQLNRQFGRDRARDSLLEDKLGFKVINSTGPGKVTDADEAFIQEVLRVYFNNDASARHQAQFLLLARRNAGNDWINVISQHRGFWRMPMVNAYYLDTVELRGTNGLPASFDFFVDMRIHRRVQAVAQQRLLNNDQPTALIESAKQVFERLRIISGAPENVDGTSIADHALDCRKWPRTQADRPRVKLIEVDSETTWNYQKGYHELVSGLSRALRNPIAHRPVDEQFIQDKFGDEVTALKLLSLISLILEQLDNPIS